MDLTKDPFMKLSEIKILTEAPMETKGKWNIGNMNGVMKSFHSPDSAEAHAWMRNKDAAPPSKETRQQIAAAKKADADAERAERAKNRKPTVKKMTTGDMYELHDEVTDAIGNSFPDGDPIDGFGDYLKDNKLTMDDVNKAFKKIEGMTYDKYMKTMWADSAADAAHDAQTDLKNGKKPHSSPFFDIKDDKVVMRTSPW
jgi:hypothetical protein